MFRSSRSLNKNANIFAKLISGNIFKILTSDPAYAAVALKKPSSDASILLENNHNQI
jgi:hypothetical protein